MIDLGNWGWWRFRGTWRFLIDWNRIEYRRFKEKLQQEIVWKLPLWVIQWAVVRAAVLAMGNFKGPDEIGYKEMYNATRKSRLRDYSEQ